MTRVRAALWHLHETGMCTANELPRLLEAESMQLDCDDNTKLNEWEYLEQQTRVYDWMPMRLFEQPVPFLKKKELMTFSDF